MKKHWTVAAVILASIAVSVSLIILLGLLLSIYFEPRPGALSVSIGLVVMLTGLLSTAFKREVLDILAIKSANSQDEVTRAMNQGFWAGFVLIVLGLLNLMGVLVWH